MITYSTKFILSRSITDISRPLTSSSMGKSYMWNLPEIWKTVFLSNSFRAIENFSWLSQITSSTDMRVGNKVSNIIRSNVSIIEYWIFDRFTKKKKKKSMVFELFYWETNWEELTSYNDNFIWLSRIILSTNIRVGN